MFEYNNAQFSGNLGKDAEVRQTPDGTTVVSFSIANNRTVKKQQITTWIRCSWFGKAAENLAQYLTKGRGVFVTGPIELQTYKDNTGVERASLALRVDSLQLLSDGRGQDDAEKTSTAATPVVDDNEEVPF